MSLLIGVTTMEVHKRVLKEKKVIKKAAAKLTAFLRGDILARKSLKYKFRSLEVGREHRLVERKDNQWELVPHSVYNHIVDRERRAPKTRARHKQRD